MKKFKFIALALSLFILVSCGKNATKNLAQTWTVTNIETTTELPDSVKTQMLSNSEMAFTKDGHYTANGGIGADQGTYTLDKDGKNLSTISEAGKSNSVYVIETLSNDKMVLKNNGTTVSCTAKK